MASSRLLLRLIRLARRLLGYPSVVPETIRSFREKLILFHLRRRARISISNDIRLIFFRARPNARRDTNSECYGELMRVEGCCISTSAYSILDICKLSGD